ncbi:3-oxoacyl-(acyl-carrier-protein) reductase [Mesorhizobium plurifarium]|uniref:3-oxoacyl-(Acyl-carrier-protein) reductase n=1 Tax=Mesorhizobium plurifarium TaxID=69974 RepID=A0A090EUX6_MESPL|nr:3-oxoacyl-(acyl-carrier-protein) reductase [Mesorhizobium sp. SOD10]CDX35296.1 3-oxoacyl-(acyl-carrier-protein) reductase [Mesorhizobium plurifarium]
MNRLTGKTAIVTGGANGIGRAFSIRLAAEGANVAIADIADGVHTVAAIKEVGGNAVAVRCDMTSEAEIAAMAKVAGDTFGGCDILVHNAGIYPTTLFEQMSFAEWRHVLALNLDSMFHLTKAVLPNMRARGWGRIIAISSTTFHSGIACKTHYSASKAGLIGFARSLASEVGEFGITVNTIAPGFIRTATTESGPESDRFDSHAQQQAIKRTGIPEDLVGPMAFLASDDAAFVTGQTILVDGGWRFI